jgi:hypothetical protein
MKFGKRVNKFGKKATHSVNKITKRVEKDVGSVGKAVAAPLGNMLMIGGVIVLVVGGVYLYQISK